MNPATGAAPASVTRRPFSFMGKAAPFFAAAGVNRLKPFNQRKYAFNKLNPHSLARRKTVNIEPLNPVSTGFLYLFTLSPERGEGRGEG